MCNWVKFPEETRKGHRIPRAGVTGSCEVLDMVLGTELRSCKSSTLSTAEPSL